MKNILIPFFLFLAFLTCSGQKLPLLKVSSDSNYIVNDNNEPFFWLGGTAWEMIHRLTREEVDFYMEDRSEKGFTVIQTVILAELDGLNTPNAYGEKPLVNNDPSRINEKYFEHVDYVVSKAEELGMYVALLPCWGDKINKRWGAGPEIFDSINAEIYGEILAQRYLSHNNIIWILGGDRAPENQKHYDIIRAMARGIRKYDNIHLVSFHPVGAHKASDYFNESWLDFDMFQSGHSRKATEYNYVKDSKTQHTRKPVINAEARYENIPDRFWENKSYGWLDDADVRISAYWSMIAGAAGYSYGCNDIWQFYNINRQPVINARTDWDKALELPGSAQMGYMKNIFELFPWQKMDLKQSLLLNENPADESHILCAIDQDRKFVLAYTPTGKPVKLDLSPVGSDNTRAFWFNPRSGKITFIGEFKTENIYEFRPWASGWGSDFLLVILAENFQVDFSEMN